MWVEGGANVRATLRIGRSTVKHGQVECSRDREHAHITGDEAFEHARERVASDRAPAFVVEPVEVATEPAGWAGEEGFDRRRELIVTAPGTEGGARHFLLTEPGKSHHRIATRSAGAR